MGRACLHLRTFSAPPPYPLTPNPTSPFSHFPSYRFSSKFHTHSTILHSTSSILHLTSYIFHLTSYILHHTSSILHLPSYIFHHSSSIFALCSLFFALYIKKILFFLHMSEKSSNFAPDLVQLYCNTHREYGFRARLNC